MPAPAVYVLAVVGTVAAGIAFKEFVYEPHIAPKLEKWAQEFLSKRRERKRQREAAISVSLPFSSKRSDGGSDDDDKSAFELEKLVSHVSEEVREWRNEVVRSQSSTLRQRKNVAEPSTLDQSNISIPYVPMVPTHVIFDAATSTIGSRAPSPSLSGSRETLRSPPPGRLPTPDSSEHGGDSPVLNTGLFSPMSIPSLSLSHPVDLDQEHGVELLSAPSSRPDTPFSTVSHTDDYHSFSADTLSSESDVDDDDDAVSVSAPPSVISDFDDLRSNFGSEISGSSWASATPRSP
ncbi:hypothetical protein BDZ89DRAFT_1125267 [Hymenopellis radicata]|nr:hypothetical protein BDZ89DRAFT_1125267 [Hymenopellis radicata]